MNRQISIETAFAWNIFKSEMEQQMQCSMTTATLYYVRLSLR